MPVLPSILAALSLWGAGPVPQVGAQGMPSPSAVRRHAGREAEPTLSDARVRVVRVIDGDTLVVLLEDREETVRLLSVDTEECFRSPSSTPWHKPATVFGEETAIWARELLQGTGAPDPTGATGPAVLVGLRFPDGERRRDVFGRLLAHVVLPDGRDLNLLLVELGRSPYYLKYGRSRRMHREFEAAEGRARSARRGVWNPLTNRPRDGASPAAARPYDRLLPWWRLRSEAIESFRRSRSKGSDGVLSAGDAQALDAHLDAHPEGFSTIVFGEVGWIEEERTGSLLAYLQGEDRGRVLAFRVPLEWRGGELESRLRVSSQEFEQNYVTLSGPLHRRGQGFLMVARNEDDLVLGHGVRREGNPAGAGPEQR